jgi:hypothetical protein
MAFDLPYSLGIEKMIDLRGLSGHGGSASQSVGHVEVGKGGVSAA